LFVDRDRFFQQNIGKKIRVRGFVQEESVSDLELILREYSGSKDRVTVICDFLEERLINFSDKYRRIQVDKGAKRVLTLSKDSFTQVESRSRILRPIDIVRREHINVFIMFFDSGMHDCIERAVHKFICDMQFSTDVSASVNGLSSLQDFYENKLIKMNRIRAIEVMSRLGTSRNIHSSYYKSRISNSVTSSYIKLGIDEMTFDEDANRNIAVVIDPYHTVASDPSIMEKVSDKFKTTAILSTPYSKLSEIPYWSFVHKLSPTYYEGEHLTGSLAKMMKFASSSYIDRCHSAVSGFTQIDPKHHMLINSESFEKPFITLEFEKTTSHSADKHVCSFFDNPGYTEQFKDNVFYRVDSPTNLSLYDGFSYLVLHNSKVLKVKSCDLGLYKPMYGQDLYTKLPKRKRTTGALCFV